MRTLCFITAEKGEVATAKGDGEKKKECTTECKSRRRRDEKAPWALNYGSGEGGGVEKGRRRGDEKRAMCVRPMATGLPSVLMLMHRTAAFAKMRPTLPSMPE